MIFWMSNVILWLQRANGIGRFALVWIINRQSVSFGERAGRRQHGYFLIRFSAASTLQKSGASCWL